MSLPTPYHLRSPAAQRDAAARAPFDAATQRFIQAPTETPQELPCPREAERRLVDRLDAVRDAILSGDALVGGRS